MTGLAVVAEAVTVSVAAGPGGEQKTLLKDVSLRIEPGEFICVLGPSGAGKSTLVRAILGERAMTAGQLLVGGHDVSSKADSLRGAIGYVPQKDRDGDGQATRLDRPRSRQRRSGGGANDHDWHPLRG